MPIKLHMLLPGSEHRPAAVRLWLTLLACLRATVELARARRVFGARSLSEILRDNRRLGQVERPAETQRVAQIGFAVTRMARRVPWRADCLVQAIAAQHWLAREGIVTEIAIGSGQSDERPFSAHAWLTCGDTIVTGGDISGFHVLVGGESTPT